MIYIYIYIYVDNDMLYIYIYTLILYEVLRSSARMASSSASSALLEESAPDLDVYCVNNLCLFLLILYCFK